MYIFIYIYIHYEEQVFSRSTHAYLAAPTVCNSKQEFVLCKFHYRAEDYGQLNSFWSLRPISSELLGVVGSTSIFIIFCRAWTSILVAFHSSEHALMHCDSTVIIARTIAFVASHHLFVLLIVYFKRLFAHLSCLQSPLWMHKTSNHCSFKCHTFADDSLPRLFLNTTILVQWVLKVQVQLVELTKSSWPSFRRVPGKQSSRFHRKQCIGAGHFFLHIPMNSWCSTPFRKSSFPGSQQENLLSRFSPVAMVLRTSASHILLKHSYNPRTKFPLWKGWPRGPYRTKFWGHFMGNHFQAFSPFQRPFCREPTCTLPYCKSNRIDDLSIESLL